MALHVIEVVFNEAEEFVHEYRIDDSEKQQLINGITQQVRPVVDQIFAVLNMTPLAGDAFRAIVEGIRRAVNLALSTAPRLSVWYIAEGNCKELPNTNIHVVGEPEISGPTGSLSLTVSGVGVVFKYSHSLIHFKLDSYYIDCSVDGDDGIAKASRFLFKLRLRFEITVGGLTVSLPPIRKDDIHNVMTTCCTDYETDDLEEMALMRARGRVAKETAVVRRKPNIAKRKSRRDKRA
ncbi:MAG TPA: hypothetical protein VMS12_07300 [Thermoanaerobaculia bacterium]|nr:hypothetical protein [Thermoanaerobaculia bacterium]